MEIFKSKTLYILLAIEFIIKLLIIILMDNGEEFTLLPFLRIQHFIDYYKVGRILISLFIFTILGLYLNTLFLNTENDKIKLSIIFIVCWIISNIFDLIFLQGSLSYLNFINLKGEFYTMTLSISFIYALIGFSLYIISIIKEG